MALGAWSRSYYRSLEDALRHRRLVGGCSNTGWSGPRFLCLIPLLGNSPLTVAMLGPVFELWIEYYGQIESVTHSPGILTLVSASVA
jgi:hypothetical protein